MTNTEARTALGEKFDQIKILYWKGNAMISTGFWTGSVIASLDGVEKSVSVRGISAYADISKSGGTFEKTARDRAAVLFAE